MEIFNLQDAETHLSRLVEEALAGREVIIAKAGKPLVRLTPFQPVQKERPLGFLAGKVRETPDCWAPDRAAFYGDELGGDQLRVAETP